MNDSPNGATPPGVPEGAMPVRMSKTIIYESFAYEINDQPQMDRRDVILTTPGGERVILPFHGDAAQKFGQKMAAPRIEVAGPGDLPAA
jgi:hypothetical protein